jgi:poly(ADP-ribose) glycohydrolase ARH3
MTDLKSKFLGGMVGSAVGDAVGELAFRSPDKETLLSRLQSVGKLSYTDDTAMAIGLAESMIEKGGIDEQHLGDTFRKNFRQEPWRGYAAGPPTVFAMVEDHGLSYREAARRLFRGKGSFGNGAAMRIAPLALCFYASPDLYEKARASAEITHAHVVGIDGAAVQAAAIAEAVRCAPEEPLRPREFVTKLESVTRTSEVRQKLALVKRLLTDGAAPSLAAKVLGQSVAVHESMPFALFAFARHAQSFEDCLFCAILNGGDRDTLGAMACAVSGAYLGVAAIPHAWVRKLENRSCIENLALQLTERARKRKGGDL